MPDGSFPTIGKWPIICPVFQVRFLAGFRRAWPAPQDQKRGVLQFLPG